MGYTYAEKKNHLLEIPTYLGVLCFYLLYLASTTTTHLTNEGKTEM